MYVCINMHTYVHIATYVYVCTYQDALLFRLQHMYIYTFIALDLDMYVAMCIHLLLYVAPK